MDVGPSVIDVETLYRAYRIVQGKNQMKGAGQIEKRPRYLVERDFRCGALTHEETKALYHFENAKVKRE
jgi:hypothetical protein